MTCPICDDAGWKTIEVDGVSRVTRCDCWYTASAHRRVTEADIPPRYRNCDLDSFNDYNDSLSAAVGKARKFVKEFPAVEKGLVFMGGSGLGKTHLAIACLKLAAHEKGLRGLFFDTRQLLRRIRQTYDPSTRETDRDVIDPALTADLLVLDDLGAERATDWVEETLHLIVNTRYNERRATIFTTNYPLEAPADVKYAEVLIERVGFRMLSRLHEMCEFVELKGVDYRELPSKASPDDFAKLDRKGSATHKDLPSPSHKTQARARLRTQAAPASAPARDLKWSGGKAGNS